MNRVQEIALNAVIGLPIWWAGWQALDALKALMT